MKKILSILIVLLFFKVSAQSHSEQIARAVMNSWKDSSSFYKNAADMDIVLQGIEHVWYATGNGQYFNYLQMLTDYFLPAYQQHNFTNGKSFLSLYRITNHSKYWEAATLLRNQLNQQFQNRQRGFWYNDKESVYRLYKAAPFYAEYAMLNHDDSALNDVAYQFSLINKYLKTEKSFSFNLEKAISWCGAALVDVLDYFPVHHPQQKTLITYLADCINRMQKMQHDADAATTWLFVYTIAKAARHHYVSSSTIETAQQWYEDLTKNASIEINDSSIEKIGASMLASIEMELLKTLNIGKGKTVLLDHYFNSESKKDITGKLMPFHYVWEEKDDNGFSLLGNIFNQYGVETKTLYDAPTVQNLKNAAIYLIVDADNMTDNPHPNYMQPAEAEIIDDWVKSGGVLVLLHNDKGNAEFEHFNQLPEKFGIHFNEDTQNKQEGMGFEFGAIYMDKGNEILPDVHKIYQKEIASISVESPANSKLQKNGINIFAVATIGKGTVFATGDPWLYNEYTDGRKLPAEYENFKAAQDWVQWLIGQCFLR